MQEDIWNEEYSKNNMKWHRETENLPLILKNMKVLELGVGNGKTLKAIIKQNPASISAVDFSEKAIEISKREFPNVRYIKADISNIPLGEKFDVIVCYYVLNNMLEKNRKETIKEIFRLLDRKGVVLFCDFEKGDLRADGKKLETGTFVNEKGIIMHFFSLNEVKSLFNKFSKIELKEIEYSPFKDSLLKRKIIQGIIEK